MVTHSTLRTLEGNHVSFENDFRFATAVDLGELPISPYTCAPISEIPCNRSTMGKCFIKKAGLDTWKSNFARPAHLFILKHLKF